MSVKAKKITIDVPLPMFEAIEKNRGKDTSTSVFVRRAIERSLRSIERAKLESELREGYIANATVGNQIAKEFEFVDAETAGQIE